MPKSLADLTGADLQQVKDLAALFFTPREIAVMLEVDPLAFCDLCLAEGTTIYQAFQGGRLQAEVDLRTSITKLAKSGSSPAQTMAMDLLKQSRAKMLDR